MPPCLSAQAPAVPHTTQLAHWWLAPYADASGSGRIERSAQPQKCGVEGLAAYAYDVSAFVRQSRPPLVADLLDRQGAVVPVCLGGQTREQITKYWPFHESVRQGFGWVGRLLLPTAGPPPLPVSSMSAVPPSVAAQAAAVSEPLFFSRHVGPLKKVARLQACVRKAPTAER